MKLTKISEVPKINPRTKRPYYYKDNPEAVKARDKKRMFVNGKEIFKSHPLYKPGRYKNFSSVAFSSMEGYENSTEGSVYIISNPAWQGWYKVGMAVDAWDRCASFQTSSPFRDYKVEYCKHFKDRRSAEKQVHSLLLDLHIPNKGEWFQATVEQLKQQIQSIEGETHESIDISV